MQPHLKKIGDIISPKVITENSIFFERVLLKCQ